MANFVGGDPVVTEFTEAPEVKGIAEKMIPAYHGHLESARIRYLFTTKDMKKHGDVVLGKAKTAGSLVKFFGQCDFVLVLALKEWSEADAKTREALVDHELCHCSFKVSEKGVQSWALRGHDIEEFREVIDRRGLWSSASEKFVETVRQLDLFSNKPKRGRRTTKK